nr:MAG: hypothetical protein [Bacteriophage sp.]
MSEKIFGKRRMGLFLTAGDFFKKALTGKGGVALDETKVEKQNQKGVC